MSTCARREHRAHDELARGAITGVLYAGKYEMLVVLDLEVSTVRVLLLRRSNR